MPRSAPFLMLMLCFVTNALYGQERAAAISKARALLGEVKVLEQEYARNNERISTLESDLEKWNAQRSQSYDNMRKKIDDKKEEFNTATVWQNRKRSAERGWKEHNPGECGAGGPPPICPVDHWYRVSVSAALAELEALKQRELDKVTEQYANTIAALDKKISDANDEIPKLRNRNWGIMHYSEIAEKRRELSNATYDWLAAVRKENEEKEKKWGADKTAEEAYSRILENNLDAFNRKLAQSTTEYLDALTGNLRELENDYNNNRYRLDEQRNRLNAQLATGELGQPDQARQALQQLSRDEQELAKRYHDLKQQLNTRLDESFRERDKLLSAMRDDTRKQIGSHRALREQKEIARQSELDNWNTVKKSELSQLEDICRQSGAACAPLYTPLSHLPEADIDIVGSLVKGLPGEYPLGEVFGEIYEAVTDKKFFEAPTYQVRRTGTQTNFETKMGVLPFVSMKFAMDDDPVSKPGLDQRLCLEVLGKESCVGVRTNAETGRNEYYISGVIKKNIDEYNRQTREMQAEADRMIRKTQQQP